MLNKKLKERAGQTIILLIVFVLIMMVALNNSLLNEEFFASEFSPMYIRGRALIEDGLSPYSAEVQKLIQDAVIGQDAMPEESDKINSEEKTPFYFLYGIPSILLMIIPILIPNAKTAMAIWLAMSEVAMIGTVFAIAAIIPKRNRRMVTIYLLASLFFIPTVYLALINGSLVILEMFFAWLVIYFIVNESDELAGIFLGLLLGRFLLFLPFMIVILIWLFSQKRFSILKSFGLTSGILIGLSFVINPQWVFELFYTISLAVNQNGLGIISTISAFLGIESNILAFFMMSVVIAVFMIEFILVLQRKMLSLVWLIVLQFSLLPLMGFPISIADYYLLYPATAIILIGWYAKLGKKIDSYLYVVTSVISFILWVLVLRNVPEIWMQMLLLILVIANLYWVRWWIVAFEKQPHSKKEKITTFFQSRFRKKSQAGDVNDHSES